MGLDTSHGCWHGAYSAFSRWREKLAEVAGFPPLLMMDGFFEPERWYVSTHKITTGDWRTFPLRDTEGPASFEASHSISKLPIKWDYFAKDPLSILLSHSDCDGEIAAEHCGPIADRLQELLPLLPAGDGGGHIGHWREKTQTFIDGLRLAAAANEPVEFH